MTAITRAQLIADLDEARARLKAVLARLDAQTIIYPEWKLKEFMDHIAGWDDAILAALRAHACGDVPAVVAPLGIDHYNAQTITTREALPLERTVGEFEVTRELIKQTLLEMPEERFQQLIVVPWGSQGLVTELIEIFVDHEHEHAAEIEKLLAEAAG